jgi:hypothetical protein
MWSPIKFLFWANRFVLPQARGNCECLGSLPRGGLSNDAPRMGEFPTENESMIRNTDMRGNGAWW